ELLRQLDRWSRRVAVAVLVLHGDESHSLRLGEVAEAVPREEPDGRGQAGEVAGREYHIEGRSPPRSAGWMPVTRRSDRRDPGYPLGCSASSTRARRRSSWWAEAQRAPRRRGPWR